MLIFQGDECASQGVLRPHDKRRVSYDRLTSAIILDADGMDKKNLYVAMTRGAKSLTILSRGTVLNPKDTAKNGQKNT